MAWRPMQSGDLAHVAAIADRVHVDYPEDAAVFAERLRLHPQGCWVWEQGGAALAGYVISHPWHAGRPPALNALLGRIPDHATTFYIHDLALLPEARRRGAAADIVARLTGHAKALGLAVLSLVAVNHSAQFWARFGFRVVDDPALNRKLSSYGGGARYMELRCG